MCYLLDLHIITGNSIQIFILIGFFYTSWLGMPSLNLSWQCWEPVNKSTENWNRAQRVNSFIHVFLSFVCGGPASRTHPPSVACSSSLDSQLTASLPPPLGVRTNCCRIRYETLKGELKAALCCHGNKVRDVLLHFCSDEALQVALFPERVERFVFVSEVRLPSNILRSLTGTLWLLSFCLSRYSTLPELWECLSFSCPFDSPTTKMD